MIYNKFFLIIFIFSVFTFAQENYFISGNVKDKSSEPLIGANITLKGSFLGGTTDFNGNYKIENLDPGKYTMLVSYIGYKSQEFEFYISISSRKLDNELHDDFSSKLGIYDENEQEVMDEDGIIKSSYHENVNFILEYDALETEQVVVSASKKQEKIIDAPITIAAISEQTIRKNVGGDLGSILKNVKGLDIYQVGNGKTAINARGFMSAFNSRFVSLIDGANYMEPTFSVAYGNSLPVINEDIERIEIVYGPSSVLYGPNAHNGLMNIITKHPRNSEGMNLVISNGSSNYSSQRFRYAKAYKKAGFKVNLQRNKYSDWKYPRVFGQDLNMDNIILSSDSAEQVIFYGDFEDPIPDVFIDQNNDGQWQNAEKLTVLESDIERKSDQHKIATMFYLDYFSDLELSFGHEYNFQHSYMPFDSGLNFIDYTVGSLWSKFSGENFFGRIHWMRSTGSKFWNSDVVYNSMLRSSLSLDDAINNSKIDNYVKTDVIGGDVQYNFDFNDIEFVSGFDFSMHRPESNRNFLNDKGYDPRLGNSSFTDFMLIDSSIIGEKIEINQYGVYLQGTTKLLKDIKFVGALRMDKHTYFDHTISPRIAFQWSGWKTGNVRFSYNRAFQTPSIYNLHALQYLSGSETGTYIPTIYYPDAFQYVILNLNDPRIQNQFNTGQLNSNDVAWFPINTAFFGNKDGFTMDGGKEISPLGIETVDGIDIGFKNVFSNKLLLDVVLFYSRYENFISPLRMIHSFYPNTYPYIPEFPSQIGENQISNWSERLTATFSYTATGIATNYGTDISIKYYHNDNLQFSLNTSIYGNIYYEDSKNMSNISNSEISADTSFNDTLNYFLNNMIKSYSFSPTELYYNAPKSKGTFAISYDNLILPDLWGELSFNYVSKFDFVSGYHVGTENRDIASLSPNLIYENEVPLGGNILMNLKLRYDINDKISIRFILNNITNKDGPRILGTPRIVRNYLMDLNYSF